MIYEFVAIRVMQRFYGGTLDVWAAEISVCLAGLAIGYYAGGRLADRFQSPAVMFLGLLLGGALGFSIERIIVAISQNVLLETDFAMQWHPLIAAMVSTFLPLVLLGTILPQAIRLSAKEIDQVGKSAGRMSAVSTVGSIAGVLLTVMYLFGKFGVLYTLYATSSALILIGMLGILSGRKAGIGAVLVLFFALQFPVHAQVQRQVRARTIYQTYSAYHHIIVRDIGPTRALLFDEAVESIMNLRDPQQGGFGYTAYFHVAKLFNPQMTETLFIGLGGGTGPKSFFRNYPDMRIVVAEIDPAVQRVAHRFFSVPKDPRLRIQIGDGRVILQRSRRLYGAIMMDAYASGPYGAYLPFHLVTREFFELAREKLENGGCLVYNTIGQYGNDPNDVLPHVLVTLEAVFDVVYAFHAVGSINTVFVAQKIDEDELDSERSLRGKVWPDGPFFDHPLTAKEMADLGEGMDPEFLAGLPGFTRALGRFSRITSTPRNGIILTDDRAATDLAYRRRQR